MSETLDIFTQHRQDMRRYAYSIVSDHGQAEDLVQESYLRFRAAMETEVIANPVGFLYQIIRNLATDYLRVQKRRGEILEQEQPALPADCDGRDPERIHMAREESDYMQAAIAELPQRCRNVFFLYRYKEKSQQEIAHTLGLSMKMVRNDLKKALQAMASARKRFHDTWH